MRNRLAVPAIALTTGALVLAQDAANPTGRKALFERSAAPLAKDTYCKVNGFPILKSDYGEWLQLHKGDTHIQEFVIGHLVRDAARTSGVSVTPVELEQRIQQRIEERILSSYRGRREMFVEKELTYYGRTMEEFKRQIGWELETELLIQKTIKARRLTTDADVEKEFRRLYGSSGRALQLRAILIEIDVPSVTSHKPVEEIQRLTNNAIEAARKKGIDIVKRLQSGALDFATAARAYSDDARSKLAGGEIGAYNPYPPMFGEEFDALVQRAKVGQVIGPVRIQQGFLIAEIAKEEVRDLRKDREALRAQLTSRDATYDEVQSFVGELVRSAKLER